MAINDIRLQRFRSYKDASFEFGERVNIIVGPNASGKTNLLEALLMLCRAHSYRASDREVMMYQADWSRLDGRVNDQIRTVTWREQGAIVQKEYKIGGTTLKRLPIARTVPVVVFEPNHLQLLTESPESRRSFIDDTIEQTSPGFGVTRRYYKRALAQRNALLKQTASPDQLFVWNVRLSELGGVIAATRQEFIATHKDLLQELYNTLAGSKQLVRLQYQSKLNPEHYSSQLLKALEINLDVDTQRGYTTIGPHRDDIVPILADHELMQTGSRGETRTMLLALKLLEVRTLETARSMKPILLLDDVFSELDGARRRALTEHLQDHQTFITTTDADIVVQHFLDNCTIIPTG